MLPASFSRFARALLILCLLKQKKKDTRKCILLFGAGDEARTRYLDLGKVALYQMSYARKRKIDYTANLRVCQSCIFSFSSQSQ